ncbi:SEL1-like repeat protein [Oxalobacter vibrioformis]|uniref:SEL1-like repeat protein n=1 Tax=Oxalobacter vibrioformis TaxID=933080 RepID=A0A9E9LUF7_9BURK|nr:SEL1-like repeat protein [Oxalobacter vibrioformis]WAW09830.1 SEL1-like repeat protein [Oxalobacter vibrioformis]
MPEPAVLPYGENLADMEVRQAAVLLLAAKAGDVKAQFELGVAFKYGKGGVARSDARAAKWFAEAARQGHPGAVYELVSRYARNTTLNKDIRMVLKLATFLAEKGDPKVQCELGYAYLASDEMDSNDMLAEKWIRRSTEKGYARAQLILSGMYFSGRGVRENPEEGVKWAMRSARQGDAEAQLAVGNLYLRGIGVVQDWSEAREWFGKAIKQGNRNARHQLMLMDEHELRESRMNGTKTAKRSNIGGYYSAVALKQSGDARARFDAGMRLMTRNDGTKPDYRLVLELFFKSAEQGNVQAMMQLARMHASGTGVRKNLPEAAKWMIQAAELGNMGAQHEVGLLYEKGEGVRRNVRRAWDWYMEAARQGHPGAEQALLRINGGEKVFDDL